MTDLSVPTPESPPRRTSEGGFALRRGPSLLETVLDPNLNPQDSSHVDSNDFSQTPPPQQPPVIVSYADEVKKPIEEKSNSASSSPRSTRSSFRKERSMSISSSNYSSLSMLPDLKLLEENYRRTSSGGHASVPSSPSKPESISTPNSGNSIDAGLTSLSPVLIRRNRGNSISFKDQNSISMTDLDNSEHLFSDQITASSNNGSEPNLAQPPSPSSTRRARGNSATYKDFKEMNRLSSFSLADFGSSDRSRIHSVGGKPRKFGSPSIARHSRLAESGSVGPTSPNRSDSLDDFSNPFDSFSNPFGEDTSSSPMDYSYANDDGLSTFDTLRREIGQLKAKNDELENIILEKERPPTTTNTLNALWQNKYYQMESHKSFAEKRQLLDQAVANHDGDSIIKILLFLKATLSEKIFDNLISKKPEVMAHYKFYLRSRGMWKALSKILLKEKNYRDAVLMFYRSVDSSNDVNDKMVILQQCVQQCEEAGPELNFLKEIIQQHWALLVRQTPIEKHDSELEKEQKDKFLLSYPRGRTLIDRSVIETLYYCLFYHYMAPDDKLSSPNGLKKAFGISETQHQWLSIEARSELRDWKAIMNIINNARVSSGIFKEERRNIVMGHENLIVMLYKHKSPKALLKPLFFDIIDEKKTFELSARVASLNVIIEILGEKQNVSRLEELKQWISVSIQPTDAKMYKATIDEILAKIKK